MCYRGAVRTQARKLPPQGVDTSGGWTPVGVELARPPAHPPPARRPAGWLAGWPASWLAGWNFQFFFQFFVVPKMA